MARLVRCFFILLRFVAVFLPIGLVFGVLFAWLEIPHHIIPQLGMPIGSIMMLVFFDFLMDGKFRCRVGGDDRMGGKLMNHTDDLASRVPVELDHPGVFHRLKRNAMKVPELLRLRFHVLRGSCVIPVSEIGGDKASRSNREKREPNGDPCLRSDGHDDGLHSSTNDEHIRHYQRERMSIEGLRVELGKIIAKTAAGSGWMVRLVLPGIPHQKGRISAGCRPRSLLPNHSEFASQFWYAPIQIMIGFAPPDAASRDQKV